MKKLYHILWILLSVYSFSGCYDDIGNYDYHAINELEVDSVRASYACDVDDSLIIQPRLKGSLYSDTTRFSYLWQIGGSDIATTQNLNLKVNMTPGLKYSRYIITDKETKVKKYHEFYVNVSSSTAGDLIMVLSKYQGRAELSYLRLDKPSEWTVNYFKDRFEKELGTEPKQLAVLYISGDKFFPFANQSGRIMTLTDNRISLLDKNSLSPDTLTPELTADAYYQDFIGEKPDISGYKSEFISNIIGNDWRPGLGGGWYQSVVSTQISGGTLYMAELGNLFENTVSPSLQSPHSSGYLAPFGYWDQMDHAVGKPGRPPQLGYVRGSFIMFDQSVYSFVYLHSKGMISRISPKDIPAYPDHTLLWGSATSEDYSLAVLANGNNCRLILLQDGKSLDNNKPTKLKIAEVSGGTAMNAQSRFYAMKFNTYVFFSAGNKLYRYDLNEMRNNNTVPGETHKTLDLTTLGLGYTSEAMITDICVSRSEKTLLLGVSRYGNDSQAADEQVKGDILYFDLDASNGRVQLNREKSRPGISGIPVDVEIKYQTFWRDGKNEKEELVDNI